ncbi:unnamed protein product [Trichobilharzia regenti]|nr:unnamed protein product [Trichobilharzia regenti]
MTTPPTTTAAITNTDTTSTITPQPTSSSSTTTITSANNNDDNIVSDPIQLLVADKSPIDAMETSESLVMPSLYNTAANEQWETTVMKSKSMASGDGGGNVDIRSSDGKYMSYRKTSMGGIVIKLIE